MGPTAERLTLRPNKRHFTNINKIIITSMLDFESSPSSQNTAQKKGSRIGEVLPYRMSVKQ